MAFSPNSYKCNFGFAFNDPKFSDRVLLIVVMANSEIGTYENAERGAQIPKRRRENVTVACEVIYGIPRNEHNIKADLPDMKDEDDDSMIDKESSGDEATKSHDAMRSTNCLTVLRVKTIHINSAILAAKSPFFYKLFCNEMEDPGERTSTLQIYPNEEAALMDLLYFIYFDTLLTTTPSGLVNILLVADKFEVASCMRYCSQQLTNRPMTSESALRYLDVTSKFLRTDAVQNLIDAAKKFLASRLYED